MRINVSINWSDELLYRERSVFIIFLILGLASDRHIMQLFLRPRRRT